MGVHFVLVLAVLLWLDATSWGYHGDWVWCCARVLIHGLRACVEYSLGSCFHKFCPWLQKWQQVWLPGLPVLDCFTSSPLRLGKHKRVVSTLDFWCSGLLWTPSVVLMQELLSSLVSTLHYLCLEGSAISEYVQDSTAQSIGSCNNLKISSQP